MNTQIDFEKSIRKRRLVYKGTYFQRLNISLRNNFIGLVVLLLFCTAFAYACYSRQDQLVIMLTAIPVLLVTISIALINKLARIEGSELRKNQSELFRLLLSRYPGIQRHNCGEKIIVITKGPRTSIFDKEILILLEESEVYLNISMLGGNQLKYVFFSIPNYFHSQAILKTLSRKVHNGNA